MRTDQSLDSSIRDNPNWEQEKKRTVALIDGGQTVTQNRIDGLRASFSGHERNRLFISGQAMQFHDLSGVSGLDSDKDGRVFIKWDYDRDGWTDVAVANTNRPLLSFYRNELGDQGASGQIVAIRFVGGNMNAKPNKEYSARNGYGAQVILEAGDLKVLREHRCGEGMAAQNSKTMLIGIGKNERVDQITVRWPSGKLQTVSFIEAGSLCTFFENKDEPKTSDIPHDNNSDITKTENGVVISRYRRNPDK